MSGARANTPEVNVIWEQFFDNETLQLVVSAQDVSIVRLTPNAEGQHLVLADRMVVQLPASHAERRHFAYLAYGAMTGTPRPEDPKETT